MKTFSTYNNLPMYNILWMHQDCFQTINNNLIKNIWPLILYLADLYELINSSDGISKLL